MPFADQVDQTVEKIIDEAIEFFMDSAGFFRADKSSNYHYVNDITVEITPPGKPARTSGGQVTKSGSPYEWGFEYGSGTNAGSLVYGHFEDTIRELFDWWRSIPDPADFDQYIDYLRDAAWYISLTSNGNKVDDIGNTALTAVEFLQKKIGGDDMNGEMILTFDQNFCTPLPSVIHGQYAVTLLAGTTLVGEKEVWDKAQKDVLGITDKMLEAMKARGPASELDIGTITALINIATLFPVPGKPILTGAGTVLSSLDTLLKDNNAPTKPKVEFASDSADGVVSKAKDALKKLAETIRGREDDLEAKAKDALNTVTGRPDSFNMPKPQLLSTTQVDGMKVDVGDLHFLATVTLPKIEKQLNQASDYAFFGSNCIDVWYRPVDIGVGNTAYGPWEAWNALATLAQELSANLAWETKSSGEHLAIAADQTGRTEDQIEASLRKHSDGLSGGSGYDPIGDANLYVKGGN